jgi:hypothetical protein
MKYRLTFGGLARLFGLLALLSSPAVAAERTKPVQTFSDWRLFVESQGVGKTCYLASEPRSSAPANVKRGDTYLVVSHRPTQGVRGEISVRIGYPFSATSMPFANVGSDSFDFITGVKAQNGADEWSWIEDLKQQPRLLRAMKRGNELVFKGTSARGTLTTDSYSLRGVTAAMKALDAACPAP